MGILFHFISIQNAPISLFREFSFRAAMTLQNCKRFYQKVNHILKYSRFNFQII